MIKVILMQGAVVLSMIVVGLCLYNWMKSRWKNKEKLKKGLGGLYSSCCAMFLWLVMGWDWLLTGFYGGCILCFSIYQLLSFFLTSNRKA